MSVASERPKSHAWFKKLWFTTQVGLDLNVLVAAFTFAYLLRFDFSLPEDEPSRFILQLPYVVLFQFAALVLTGVYKFVWRYVGMVELQAFARAAFYSTAAILLVYYALPESLDRFQVPRSIIVVDTLLAFGGVFSLRVLRRGLYERQGKRHNGGHRRSKDAARVLMIGAGRAGMLAAREARSDHDTDVKGFVDDDPDKLGAVIQGVKVLGTTDDIPRLVEELRIDHVVITFTQAPQREMRRILSIANGLGIKARIIPSLQELVDGSVQVSNLRDVSIEDLLGREPVRLDENSLRVFLSGRVVLVTGGGGSIGSELARQIVRFGPSRLVLVERNEFALFEIEREVRRRVPDVDLIPVIGDVGDGARMRHVLSTYRPDVLIHAAAHKHVPLMESNASEAIKNNVLATRTLGEIAGELGVGTFVMISTDKAVRPTSVMGASKRMAELIIQDLSSRELETRYVVVRFGNVLGSTGSVIPIFREQIAQGGPVTVTAPDMTRYFMTIPEASQLVLQAGAMGEGGEIFVLDMGAPVGILDLAKDMITLSGLRPFEDIDIVFSGPRPGEKKFEELELADEHLTPTRHPKILMGTLGRSMASELMLALHRLAELAENGQEGIHAYLNGVLPEANLRVNGSPKRASKPWFRESQSNVKRVRGESTDFSGGATAGRPPERRWLTTHHVSETRDDSLR